MKKKILAVCLVLALAVSSLFASSKTKVKSVTTEADKDKLGIGVAVGYPAVSFLVNYTKADMSDLFGFRFHGTLGWGFENVFHLDAECDWLFAKLVFQNTGSKQAENSTLDFGLGAGLLLEAAGWGVGLGPVASLSFTYSFARDWTVFLRGTFGWEWRIGPATNSWYAAGNAGFTYEFDLAKQK